MFYVGQKVVCVNATPGIGLTLEGIEAGQTYTVRWVGPYVHVIKGEHICIRLAEVNVREMPYDARRFRPIRERKTDIGFAHEILRKVTKRKPAHV